MKLRSICGSVLLLLALAGCKKNNDTTGNTIYLLSQIIHVTALSTDTTYFKYDGSNRLTEASSYYSKYDIKYTYDSNDRLIEENDINLARIVGITPTAASTTQYLFTYAPNVITSKVTFKSGTTTKISTEIHSLNSEQLTTKLDYGNGEYSLYTYDNNGNVLSQYDYFPTASTSLYTFNYTNDQSKSYYTNIKGNFFSIYPMAHNNNRITYYYSSLSATNTILNTHMVKSTFEFNRDGYPVKETAISTLTNNPTTYTDTFYYVYITR